MIVSINQPAYLPWLGYFERIARSDLHVVLDLVQYEKNSFTNRNRIRTPNGELWLTVPLSTKGRFGSLEINRLEFARNTPWRRKHWDTLCMNYRKAPHFARYAPAYEALYQEDWPSFMPMVRAFLSQHLADLGILTPLVYSSERNPSGTKTELLVNLCRDAAATRYVSGAMGRDYLDEGMFSRAGISVCYQDYVHPEYRQCHAGFVPRMGILDLLFNEGPRSLKVLLTHTTNES
jgi:hypothetical protein